MLLDEILEELRTWTKRVDEVIVRDISYPFADCDFTRNKIQRDLMKAFSHVIRKKKVRKKEFLGGVAQAMKIVADVLIHHPQHLDWAKQFVEERYLLCEPIIIVPFLFDENGRIIINGIDEEGNVIINGLNEYGEVVI